MNEQNVPEEPEEDHVGKIGGIVALVIVFLFIIMNTGTAGVILALGFLALWGVFSALGRLFKRNQRPR